MEGNNFINELLNEINHVRLNPKSYAKKLRMCAQSFDGDVLRLPELKNGLITNEGAIAYEEAAAYVENLPKLPMIHLDPNLSFAAQAIANEMTYYNDVSEMNSINREEIMEQYGKYEGAFAMSSDFGSLTPEFVVMNLIVDDGNKSRNNRKMMFDGRYYKIGLGTCKHSTFRQYTVILYVTNFIKGTGKTVMKKAKVSNYPKEEDIDYQEELRVKR